MSSENGQLIPNGLPAVTEATVISRSPAVLAAEVDGEILIMNLERGSYFNLNEVGSDVWQRLDAPCSFVELIDHLAADFDAARATIAEDVQALLSQMAAEDIVRLA